MDLGGKWVAAPGGGAVSGFPDLAYDDSDWVPVEVPGHWGRVSELADAASVRYRHRFSQQPPAGGERRWLVFEGLLYQADVWLNGGYLGDVEGYFMAHQFDVTGAMAGRREHLLALELSCPARSSDISTGQMLGSLGQAPELLPPGNPGGLWAPIRMESTGEVRILALRVGTESATDRRAVVALQADLDTSRAGLVRLHTAISNVDSGKVEHTGDHVLAAGLNHVEWRVEVPEPHRWWPHELGDQPLYDVTVEVGTTQGGLSDRRRVRTGLRAVQMDNWQFSVNGVRIFLKGTSFGPATPWWAEADEAGLRRDVELAKEAGLNLIRAYGHVAQPSLYDAADEAGMLIWQDLPLVGPFPRGNRDAAGGFCQHFFADSHPAVSTALVDWQRWPKPAYEALAKACQPVIVVADRPPAELTPGDELSIGVHVVSDCREPVVGLHAEAILEWPSGSQAWNWEGTVGRDECVQVGTLHWRVPDASGPAALHLRLTGPVEATNRYDAVIFG